MKVSRIYFQELKEENILLDYVKNVVEIAYQF